MPDPELPAATPTNITSPPAALPVLLPPAKNKSPPELLVPFPSPLKIERSEPGLAALAFLPLLSQPLVL